MKFINQHKEILLQIGFCIFVSGSIILFYWGTTKYLYNQTFLDINSFLTAKDALINKYISSLPNTNVQVKNLQSEFAIIQNMKQPYLIMAKNATVVWYGLTGTFTFTAVVTGILGFLMAKKGWDHTNNFYVKSTFIIFFFSSTYYGIAPVVFNNKETGNFNMNKYCLFSQQQFILYGIAKQYSDPKTAVDIKLVNNELSKIDSIVRSNQDFYFDIHQDQVPDQKNIIKQLKTQ